MRKKIIICLWIAAINCCVFSFAFAQGEKNNSLNGFNEVMRSNNKIYVVMGVCVTILIGLILYIASIDRKISKKEQGL